MIENLWRMSIYGSVMILLVLAVRFLMRKYPKEYICALWMMVLVRLLIPIFIAGRGSLQPDLQVFNWPSVVRVLKLIYLAGMILTVAAFLVQYVQMKRRTASAVPDGKNIWLCEEIPLAFVMGVIRPRIYLPDSLNTVERWYVVKHEEMHIRHADPWMRAAGTKNLF